MDDRADAEMLVASAAEAWRLREAAEPERSEARQRYDDARAALGIEVDFLSEERPRGFVAPLWWLLHRVVESIDDGTNPFRTFLEAPSAIIEIYQRHKAALISTPVPRAVLVEIGVDTLLAALAQPDRRSR